MRPWLLLSLLLSLPAPLALAQDETFEEEELEEEVEGDTEAVYKEYAARIAGDDPTEQIDAWYRYLDLYPDSKFKMEIERRIEALEDQAYDSVMEEELQEEQQTTVDAKDAEINVMEPALLHMNANPRRRIEASVLWGATDLINYEANLEWAFFRRLSAFGGIRHRGRGGAGVGANIYGGAKGAIVKDTRTGIVMSGALAVQFGFNSLERAKFELEPWYGFAWVASDRFQLQTSLSMVLRLDNIHTQVNWDFAAMITPIPVLSIHIETRQKHRLYKPPTQDLQYLTFMEAGAGVKIRPTDLMELTVGVNVPYFYRYWKDYQYFGVHAGAVFYFKKRPAR